MQTFSDKLILSSNRPSGFDYLRISLSVSVVTWHTVVISYGTEVQHQIFGTPLGGLARLILPMFFALSGFLVAGSLERCRTLISFLGLRIIRIYPALMTEVIMSAFVLGPLTTHLPLQQYFTNATLLKYMINATGHPYFHLPGVFLDNPLPNVVNQQLWTVPWELYCYFTLSLLFIFGLRKRKAIIWIPFVIYFVWQASMIVTGELQITKAADGPVSPVTLIFFFLAGVGIYLYRAVIPRSQIIFVFCVVSAYLLIATFDHLEFVIVPLAAYATVYIGTSNPRRLGFIGAADYSYGIYLYSFPIQQAIAHLFPGLREWYWNLAIGVPVSIGVAMLSWYLIEKPAFSLKPKLALIEEVWLKHFQRQVVTAPAEG